VTAACGSRRDLLILSPMRRYSAGIIAAIAATAVLAAPAWGQTTTGRTGNPGVDFIRKTVAFQRVFKRTLRRIAAVEPPAEIAEPVGDWVDALRRTKRLTDQFIRAAKAGNGAASVRLVKKISKAQTQSSNKAKRLDLDRCTQ
jgi:hypothetical protein